MEHTFCGNHGPVAVMHNGKQIAGAVKQSIAGKGRVGFDGVYNAKMPSVKVEGAGRQEKLSGKNLLPFPYYQKDGFENNGITYTVLSDRGLHIKGTSTGYPGFIFANDKTEKLVLEDGKHYWFSPDFIQRNAVIFINYYDENGKNQYHNDVIWKKEYRLIRIFVQVNPGVTIDTVIYPQLEVGDGITPFEPYCGGIPAPNPDYPIEPEFLEGAELQCKGKNLLIPYSTERTPFFLKKGTWVGIRTDGRPSNGGNVMLFDENGKTIWVPIDEGDIVSKYKIGLSKNIYAIKNGLSNDNGHMFFIYDYPNFDAPDYEPVYSGGTAQLPILRALPDGSVKDEYDVVSGKLTRRIWEETFDGSEDEKWGWFKFGSICYGAYIMLTKFTSGKYSSSKGLCNYAVLGSNSNLMKEGSAYFSGTKGTEFNIGWTFDANYTIEQFLDVIRKNPLTVWYPLVEPVVEQYDPAVIRQHPGYTQLLQQDGFTDASIEAEVYKEI